MVVGKKIKDSKDSKDIRDKKDSQDSGCLQQLAKKPI